MATRLRFLLPLAAACAACPAVARNELLHIPFQEVLDTPQAKEKLDASVKFYLAGTRAPAVAETRGREKASRHSLSIGKSADQACYDAALRALLALQQRAKAMGADAIVDIVSMDQGQDVKSATTYECRSGAMITGVTLKGTYAKLAR